MSSQPSYPPSRPNLTGIVAACILSGGLITASIIDSHKLPTASFPSAVTDAGRRTPPISKESIRAQVTSQLLAAMQLRGVKPSITGPATGFWFPASEVAKGRLWNLTGATVTDISYRAKDDQFDLTFDLVWQDDEGTVVHVKDLTTLSNDGYDQYHEGYDVTCVESASSGGAPTVNLTLK